MSFRDNLQHLRATRNMTQEQLAMLVGVSRQSVTKWEAERAYPEMDKLLKLCDIFGCTMDELVQGDLTGREAEPSMVMPEGPAQDVFGYDELMRSHAWRLASGVTLIIAGVAFSALLGETNGTGVVLALEGARGEALAGVPALLGVAAGCALIIPASITRSAFVKAHPYLDDFYATEDRAAASALLGKGVAAGVSLMILGCVAASALGDLPVAGFSLLMPTAIGVGLIVWVASLSGRVDIASYNKEVLHDLPDDEIVATLGQERGQRAIVTKRRSRRLGARCGIIMLVATIVGLLLLFSAEVGGPWASAVKPIFWVPWPVGGIACGIVSLWELAFSREAREG
ncbi:helix-turn-helix transcriptional regulator [Olsenella sp. HMSC062G07]|uniref:helix-turn-helix transcriptional regulator n=1 Tax=Olsenella sp. HMSC062G07 TaxID=1739330 RepID=UPI0008A302CF|nr:helix-turn-helix transcriptional regulator [Olsenella sp. HMSC062G07]OFK25282.1 hypothetical protein HMPREF2826_03000 [Olsenella sp. HMSC062G07]